MTKTSKTPKSKWIRYKYPSRPEVFEAFSKWLAYPKSFRKPKTQGQFAKIHEISPDSLSDYKKKNELWEKVEEYKNKLKNEIADSIMIDKVMKDIEKLN